MLRRMIRKCERGQVAMIFALMIPVLGGMAGMAVDAGSYASERRTLQNAADAIALAAAQELPNEGNAQAKAIQWAQNNNIPIGQMTVTVTGGTTSPAVVVEIQREHEFGFVRLVGVDEATISSRAKAVKVSVGGNNGIVPWAVTADTVAVAPFGQEIVLKYDSTGVDNGNFGAIRIDGAGSSTYLNSVKYGSTTYACAQSAPTCVTGACPGTYPSVCAETAPECDGPECSPQTGNMTGNTKDGVDFRMNYTMDTCNSFEEVFTDDDNDETYTLDPDCNPWINGAGKCDSTTDLCSRRVFMIPVVDDFGNGTSDPLTVQRFALIFLEGYEGTCTGSSCEIVGRFVKADLTTNALAGTYDEGAMIHFIKLTE